MALIFIVSINANASEKTMKYTFSTGMAKLSGEATVTNLDDSSNDSSYDIDRKMTYLRIGTIKDKSRHQLRFGLEYSKFNYKSYEVTSIGGYGQFVKKLENKKFNYLMPYISANFGLANQEYWDNGFMVAITPGLLFNITKNIEIDLGYGLKKLIFMKDDESTSESYMKEEMLTGINLGINIKF